MNVATNFSQEMPVDKENETLVSLPWVLLLPEFLNFTFLSFGVFGMYQGTEIFHPIYANLILNLLFPLTATIIEILAFAFIDRNHYVLLSNGGNGFSLEFHCNCWCITSFIRYIYILHDDWIHSVIPNMKVQCALSIAGTFGLFIVLLLPQIGYAIYLGKHFQYFHLLSYFL